MKTNVTELGGSEVRIDVILEAQQVEKYREEVTHELSHELEIDGFRKGKVPHDVAIKNLDPMKIYEEMAHHAIWSSYAEVLKDTNVQAIGTPSVAITKITPDSPLEFSITTAVMPLLTLGDYKDIAKKVAREQSLGDTVSDNELNEMLLNLRKMRAQEDLTKKAQESETEAPSWSDINEEDLPAIDDEWISSIGPFKSVEEFLEKMKSNLQAEKEAKSIDKQRTALIDGILETSQIEVPNLLINYEIDKMMHEFEHSITMTGMSFDEYLTSIQKTRDDYREAWKEQAKKRAQTELMLTQIATLENLTPNEESVRSEVEKIMDQYKDHHHHIDENAVRTYVTTVLSHQRVFEFLESIQ